MTQHVKSSTDIFIEENKSALIAKFAGHTIVLLDGNLIDGDKDFRKVVRRNKAQKDVRFFYVNSSMESVNEEFIKVYEGTDTLIESHDEVKIASGKWEGRKAVVASPQNTDRRFVKLWVDKDIEENSKHFTDEKIILVRKTCP